VVLVAVTMIIRVTMTVKQRHISEKRGVYKIFSFQVQLRGLRHEQLIVSQLAKEPSVFIRTRYALACLKVAASGTFPEPGDPEPYLSIHFNIIFQTMPMISRHSYLKVYMTWILNVAFSVTIPCSLHTTLSCTLSSLKPDIALRTFITMKISNLISQGVTSVCHVAKP
jgi:hypothetical protein